MNGNMSEGGAMPPARKRVRFDDEGTVTTTRHDAAWCGDARRSGNGMSVGGQPIRSSCGAGSGSRDGWGPRVQHGAPGAAARLWNGGNAGQTWGSGRGANGRYRAGEGGKGDHHRRDVDDGNDDDDDDDANAVQEDEDDAQAANCETGPYCTTEGCTSMAIVGRALWKAMHTLSFHYPDTATPDQRRAARNMVDGICELLPCEACRKHFTKLKAEMPLRVNTRAEFSRWMVDAHNKVNERLGKPTMTHDDAMAIYVDGDEFPTEYGGGGGVGSGDAGGGVTEGNDASGPDRGEKGTDAGGTSAPARVGGRGEGRARGKSKSASGSSSQGGVSGRGVGKGEKSVDTRGGGRAFVIVALALAAAAAAAALLWLWVSSRKGRTGVPGACRGASPAGPPRPPLQQRQPQPLQGRATYPSFLSPSAVGVTGGALPCPPAFQVPCYPGIVA